MPKGQGRPNSTPGTAVSDPLSARDIPSPPPKAHAHCDWREKVRRLLPVRGRTQKALAAEVGVAYNSFRSYLGAIQSSPGMLTGMKIARALNVSADWLFDDDQPWPPPATEGPEHAVTPAEAELLELTLKAYHEKQVSAKVYHAVLRQLLDRAIRRVGLNVPPAMLDSAPANTGKSQQEQGGRAIPRS